MEPEERERLAEVADAVGELAAPRGFALFLVSKGRISYLSNVDSPSAVVVLEEWLSRVPRMRGGPRAVPDAPTGRETIERSCAEIGTLVAKVSHMVLFLFDVGDVGNRAYFANFDGARDVVRLWVEKERSLS